MQTFIHIIADLLVVPVVAIGAAALLCGVKKGQRTLTYSYVFLAGLTSYVCAKIVGLLYQPATARPFEQLGVDPGASFLNNPGFPSDHALFVMVIAFAVFCVVRPRWVGWVLIGLGVVVCVGRVAALVHTPLDVIGGIAVASIGTLWYIPLKRATNKPEKSQKGYAKRT